MGNAEPTSSGRSTWMKRSKPNGATFFVFLGIHLVYDGLCMFMLFRYYQVLSSICFLIYKFVFYRCIDVLIYSVYSFVSFCQRATTFQSRAPCALVEEGLDQWLHSGWWRLESRYHRSARRTSVGWEGHGEFCRNWGVRTDMVRCLWFL